MSGGQSHVAKFAVAATLCWLGVFCDQAQGRVLQRFSSVKKPVPAPQLDTFENATLAQQKAERVALLALKEAFGNHPIFDYGEWEATLPKIPQGTYPCNDSWYGVVCSGGAAGVNGRVISIALPYTKVQGINPTYPPLTGVMPWDKLAALNRLKFIDFTGNMISGAALPSNVSNFPLLQEVHMQGNSFNSSLPANMAGLASLQYVDVSINYIPGQIPRNLDQLPYLQTLSLYQNQLNGTLPAEIGNSLNLQGIDVGQNSLSGTMPAQWGNLKQLLFLSVQKASISGGIPESYANLTSLRGFDISSNQMTGELPTFVTKWNLTNFDIHGNLFYGPIPSGILETAFRAPTTLLDVSYNYFNSSPGSNPNIVEDDNCIPGQRNARNSSDCNSFFLALDPSMAPHISTRKSSSVPVVAIVVPIVVVCAVVLAFLYLCMRRKRAQKATQAMFSKNFKNTVASFSLADLRRATKNFSQTIGKGGYGTVYKAVLKDGTIVAVKRLDQVSKQGDVEFIREVELLSRLHHRHLVNLVGFCAERGERILVYEYMAMGSLYEHLHGASSKEYPLSWDSRTKISIHIALGLEYLHYGADPPLIHRDIKSANILLSEDGYSKVADFGLCKEAPLGADGSETMVPTATAVRGSFGYLDPEYVNTSILSEKSDVYSYGVVLLELISGHKSIHEWQPLAYWAEEFLADREKTALMVDPLLEGNFDIDELYAICDIARTCVQDQAILRPTIRDVAKALVENLGHTLSSYDGSTRDSGSVMSSGGMQSDTSSVTGSSYTPANHSPTSHLSYQNYSETLRWSPPDSLKLDSGKVDSGGPNRYVAAPQQKRAGSKKKDDSRAASGGGGATAAGRDGGNVAGAVDAVKEGESQAEKK